MCDREQIVTSRWCCDCHKREANGSYSSAWYHYPRLLSWLFFSGSSCDISFFSFIFYVFKKYLFNGRRAASSRPPPTEGHGDACNRRLHFCVVHWIKKNMYNIYHETPPEKKNAFYAAAATKNSVKTTSSSSRSTVQLLILKDKNSIWSCGGTKF